MEKAPVEPGASGCLTYIDYIDAFLQNGMGRKTG
jgi:hypothetical protein